MKIDTHIPQTPQSIGGRLELSYDEIHNICREFRNMRFLYREHHPAIDGLWNILWQFYCVYSKTEESK
jgi:hypothetical protein